MMIIVSVPTSINIIDSRSTKIIKEENYSLVLNLIVFILTKKVIALAKTMKHLEAMVHVSTAYANCDLRHISEEVYNPPVKAEKLIEACDWMNDEVVDLITPKVIQNKPNTYTYTKQIAESVVMQECKDMPCSIVRPSIIGASWREPFAGWVENFNGPTAIFPASGSGFLQTMMGNHEAIADIIPVDVTVNLLLAVAWYTAKKTSKKIQVFNNTSGQINKFTWGMFESYFRDAFDEYPYERIYFVPDPYFTSNRLVLEDCFFSTKKLNFL